MRVALDGGPLGGGSGGLRRYTGELLSALRHEFREDVFEPLEDGGRRLWWSVRLPATLVKDGWDVFHGTNFEVPYLPVRPAVLSVHDISPWMDPAWHCGADRVRSRTPALMRLGLPSMIITGTQAVRRQIIDMFNVHPDRVAVVPDAPGPQFRPINVPVRRPYFLIAGTIEPRKNVPAAIDAWRCVRSRYDVDLVIAGRRREDAPVLPPAGEGLEYAGDVTDEELASLYSGAVALVYPSFYEGFGLPVVEAMQCGTAVVASADPALVEVSGGAAIHVRDEGLADALEVLLTNPEERLRRIEAGQRRAAEFSWGLTARMTREVYVEAIARHRTLA